MDGLTNRAAPICTQWNLSGTQVGAITCPAARSFLYRTIGKVMILLLSIAGFANESWGDTPRAAKRLLDNSSA